MTSSKFSVCKASVNDFDDIKTIEEFVPIPIQEITSISFEKLVSISFTPNSGAEEESTSSEVKIESESEVEAEVNVESESEDSNTNLVPNAIYILRHRFMAIGVVVVYDENFIIFRTNDTISIANDVFDKEKIFPLLYTVRKVS